MPQWKKLPDGSWDFVPDNISIYNQLSQPYSSYDWSQFSAQSSPFQARERQQDGSLFGSAIEGLKSIPAGFVDVPARILQSGIGAVTPFADLPIEKRLREAARRRQQEGFVFRRDPTYLDAFLPDVGAGLGQVGALSLLGRLATRMGPYGLIAGGVALGISEQINRMADQEQKSGKDIPWYTETPAHLIGGLIGLSEMVTPLRLLKGFPGAAKSPFFKRMIRQSRPATAVFSAAGMRSALGSTGAEALQEGFAQGLQSATARGLYDPDALKDVAHSMMEEAKVGGVVGGIADVLATSMRGYNIRGMGYDTEDHFQEEVSLQRADARRRKSKEAEDFFKELDSSLVRRDIDPILKEYGISEGLAEDIHTLFHGAHADMPLHLEHSLASGELDVETMAVLRNRFSANAERAAAQLEKLSNKSKSPLQRRQLYRGAKAIREILGKRLSALDKRIELAGYGIVKLGGLTDSTQYQAIRSDANIPEVVDSSWDTIVGIGHQRDAAIKAGQPMPEYKTILEDYMGGSAGRIGLFRMAEVLGVHGGPGSDAIDVDRVESNGHIPDKTLSSSEAANFSLGDVGRVLFGRKGDRGVIAGLQYTDDLGLSAELETINERIKTLEGELDKAYTEHPRFREVAEAKKGEVYESDDAWTLDKNKNIENWLLKSSQISSLIAGENFKRNELYSRMVLQRLLHAKRVFDTPGTDPQTYRQNKKLKLEAANDLELTTSKDPNEQEAALDAWLQQSIEDAQNTYDRSVERQARLDARKAEIEKKIASTEDESLLVELRQQQVHDVDAHKMFTRDTSAAQLARLATFFNKDVRARRDAIDQRLMMRAYADISGWASRNDHRLTVAESGQTTSRELKKFIEDVLPTRLKRHETIQENLTRTYEKLRGSAKKSPTFESLVRAQFGDGRDSVRKYEEAYGLVTADDVETLLKSKNIFLRGGVPGKDKDKAVKGNIGKTLERRLGTGVESRPFKSLLQNLTGAKSWATASPGQRLLMYSRLLQLPAHRMTLDPRGKVDSEGGGFMPLFLPTFEHNPKADEYLESIMDVLIRPYAFKDERAIPGEQRRTVQNIRNVIEQQRTQAGQEFDGIEFDEALATLIESGVLDHGESSDADLIEEGAILRPSEGSLAPTREGQLGSPSNPKTAETVPELEDVLTFTEAGEGGLKTKVDFNYRGHPLSAITLGHKTIITVDNEYSSDIQFGDILELDDPTGLEDEIRRIGDEYEKGLITDQMMDFFLSKAGHRILVRAGGQGTPLAWRFNYATLSDIATQLSNYRDGILNPKVRTANAAKVARIDGATEPVEFDKARVVPMRYRDGDQGLAMRPGLEGATTLDLIRQGLRTSTSRQKRFPITVGQIIKVQGKDRSDYDFVRVTSGWKSLDEVDQATWTEMEGWGAEAYEKLRKKGYSYFTYERVDPSEIASKSRDAEKAAIATAVVGEVNDQLDPLGNSKLSRYMEALKPSFTAFHFGTRLFKNEADLPDPSDLVTDGMQLIRLEKPFTSEDVIWVSTDIGVTASTVSDLSNVVPVERVLRAVVDGELQGVYKAVDLAIEARASIVMDKKDEVAPDDVAQKELIAYLEDKGYVRMPEDSSVAAPIADEGGDASDYRIRAWAQRKKDRSIAKRFNPESSNSGVWVYNGAVDWAQQNNSSARPYAQLVKDGAVTIPVKPFESFDIPDWTEYAAFLEDIRTEYAKSGVLPYLTEAGFGELDAKQKIRNQLIRNPSLLTPASSVVHDLYSDKTASGLTIIGELLSKRRSKEDRLDFLRQVLPVINQVERESRTLGPTIEEWKDILSTVGLKHVPYSEFMPDVDVDDISDDDLKKYEEESRQILGDNTRLDGIEFSKEDLVWQRRYQLLHDLVAPEAKAFFVVGSAPDADYLGFSSNFGSDAQVERDDEQYTFINRAKMLQSFELSGEKAVPVWKVQGGIVTKDQVVRGGDTDSTFYANVRKFTPDGVPGLGPDGFERIEDSLVMLIAHEKAHSFITAQLVGTERGQFDKGQGDISSAIYEDVINNYALNELPRLAWAALRSRMETRRLDKLRAAPKSFKADTVSPNLNIIEGARRMPLGGDFVSDVIERQAELEDQSPRSDYHKHVRENKKIFEAKASAVRVKEILNDPKMKKHVDDAVRRWNKQNEKKITRKEYIERYASQITSTLGLQALEDAGVLESVSGRLRRAENIPATESVLRFNTSEGSKILSELIVGDAVPTSIEARASAVRRAHLEESQKRFGHLKTEALITLAKLRVPDNIKTQFVDDIDGLFQGNSEVMVRGEMLPQTRAAVYDSAANRIIINLAAIDPDNMMDAEMVIREAVTHEAIHALKARGHFYESELSHLRAYVRNNVVPEEWDKEAHDMGLTWFEREVYRQKESNLGELEVEEESILALMQALSQDGVPEAREGGSGAKLRKTKNRMMEFFDAVVGAAKETDIGGVMKIFSAVESGAVGMRGAGYRGETDFDAEKDEIRSMRLSRYADPAELQELTKAIALRDAAPNESMRSKEQEKVDKIADRIVGRRSRIQESANPVDGVQAIDNERRAVEEVRATNSYAIPLLGNKMWTAKDNRQARDAALDEYFRIKKGESGYTMPRDWMNMFDNQTRNTTTLEDLVKEAIENGLVTPTAKGGSFKKSLEEGVLGPDSISGNNPEETLENIKTSRDQLRYQFLDRRQWVVKQTDRLLELQNRASIDAETAALVAIRNADNAVNWLEGIMERGPMSYLGQSTSRGSWDIAPVYDDQLQEKYGGDGQVGSLLDIFAFIANPKDEQAAAVYGMAKRIRWTRLRRDETRAQVYPDPMRPNIERDLQSPELASQLRMFDEAYERINPKNKKTGERMWSEAFLDKVIEDTEANNEHIIEFWDHYQAFNRAMIETSYRAGLLTRSQRDEWIAMPYTPFYRDTSKEDQSPIGSSGEMVKRGKVMVERAIRGSFEPIKSDLVSNIMENTQALIRDMTMNVATARTARDAVSLGDAEQVSVSDMRSALDDRIVRVMENGKATYYRFADPQLAMSVMMLGFNPKKQLADLFGGTDKGKALSKIMTGPAQLLRTSVTKTPAFHQKNIFRDSWNASTLIGGGPGLLLDSLKNAIDPSSLRRAQEKGLSVGIDFVANPDEYGLEMRKQLDRSKIDWTNPLSPVAAMWHFLGRLSKQSEVATRLAVYDRVMALTGDRALAQYLAIEIMNYGRRGANQAFSTFLSTVPFMNGRLQGLDVLYRGIRSGGRSGRGVSDIPGIWGYGLSKDQYKDLPLWKRNRSQLVGRGMQLTAATMLYYLMMHDDEEYQGLRDEEKADNWLLPLSGHAWFKLPIPFEVGVLFKVIPEQLMMAILEKEHTLGDAGAEAVRQLRTSLSFGAPQFIAPLYNAARNYDTYRKDAIVDQWTALREPNQQREMYTSNVARSIADTVNAIPGMREIDFLSSPMKVEYLMRQYLGTMGMYGITIADRVARQGYLPLPNWSDKENIVGTSLDFDFESVLGGPGVVNVPLLGDLLTDPRVGAGRQQDFYEVLGELDEVVATLNSINETDRREGFAYAQKHRAMLAQKNRLSHLRNQMRAWRIRREALQKRGGSMTIDEKRAQYLRMLETREGILTGVRDIMAKVRGA